MRPILLLLAATFTTLAATPCLEPNAACSEPVQLPDGWLLVYRNFALTQANPGLTRAVIVLHGAQRNGDGYFATALGSAASRGALMNTLIVAPHFKGNDGRACKDPVAPGEFKFGCGQWNAGYAALGAQSNSFDVMDRLLQMLADSKVFPNLKEIVFAGHSAGGQFNQRYAAMNQVDGKLPVPIRYVVANPSSYLYLDEMRLRGTCAVDGTCTGTWAAYSDAANCTTYNRYRYGLDKPEGYLAQIPAEQVKKQLATRQITYLIGDLDQLPDTDLDKSCPAMAQGLNRRERGINYWNYIRARYHAQHQLVIVPRCGHNAACMFVSAAGAKVLFP
jgi:pimeloyl-ACP methyl ester carboxylesterase